MNEWDNEPDFEEFTIRGWSYMHKPHKQKRFRKKYAKQNIFVWKMISLHCEIRRHPEMLHLNGYICVPQQHPFWGWHYDHVDVHVHGGLTFGHIRGKSFEFGFDCAHFMDRVPGMDIILRRISTITTKPELSFPTNDVYRNMNYVTRQLISLANQLLIHQEEILNGYRYNRSTQRTTFKRFTRPVFDRQQSAYGQQERSNLGASGN